MQQTLYLIATTSRSGSTHLCELLTSTHRLGAPDEYFNPNSVRPAVWAIMRERPQGNFDAVYFRRVVARTSSPNGVCGIKLSTSAFMALRDALDDGLDLLRPRFIWLRRRDVLRQAISLYRAQATGVWHWSAGDPCPRACPPFDEQRILEYCDQITAANAQWSAWFAESAARPLELWYEDFIRAPQATTRSVCRFVGVSDEGLSTPRSGLRLMRDSITEEWVAQIGARRDAEDKVPRPDD